MNSLIIDTSTNNSCLIIVKNNSPLIIERLHGGKELSTKLIPTIDEMLTKSSLSFNDLNFIATAAGPGSYTGIRIGAAFAKTLAYSKKIPLMGFSSLLGYIPTENTKFISAIDAKAGGLYIITGEKKEGTISYFTNPVLVSLDKAITYFEQIPYIISPDIEAILERFSSIIDISKFIFLKSEINIDRLYSLTTELFEKKEYNTGAQINLLYLRGPKLIDQ